MEVIYVTSYGVNYHKIPEIRWLGTTKSLKQMSNAGYS